MTFPTDPNQQLLAYLQAWRQVLEALTGMANPMLRPGTPWMVPPLPPMPIPPSAPTAPPADYPRQLFEYLQAWRQNLEQMAGAHTTPAQSAGSGPAQHRPAETPHEGSTMQAGDSPAGAPTPQSNEQSGSSPFAPPNFLPAFLANQAGSQITARKEFGSQFLPDPTGQAPARVRARLIPRAPDNEFGSNVALHGRPRPSAVRRDAAAPPTETARVNPATSETRSSPRALFRGLSERAGISPDRGSG